MSLGSITKDCDILIKKIFEDVMTNPEKTLHDYDISIFTLFLSLNDKLKAIGSLIELKNMSSAHIIVRSFIEQSVYLEFILESNTERRGKALFLFESYDGIKKSKYALDNLNNREFAEQLRVQVDQKAKESESPRNTLQEELDYTSNVYKSMFPTNTKSKYYRYWFDFERPGTLDNFQELAKKMNKFDLYLSFYKPTSNAVHGSDATSLLRIINRDFERREGEIVVKSIMEQGTLDSIESITVTIFEKLSKHYRYTKNHEISSLITKQKINLKSKIDRTH